METGFALLSSEKPADVADVVGKVYRQSVLNQKSALAASNPGLVGNANVRRTGRARTPSMQYFESLQAEGLTFRAYNDATAVGTAVDPEALKENGLPMMAEAAAIAAARLEAKERKGRRMSEDGDNRNVKRLKEDTEQSTPMMPVQPAMGGAAMMTTDTSQQAKDFLMMLAVRANKCRKVYGVERMSEWCRACQGKNRCQRFADQDDDDDTECLKARSVRSDLLPAMPMAGMAMAQIPAGMAMAQMPAGMTMAQLPQGMTMAQLPQGMAMAQMPVAGSRNVQPEKRPASADPSMSRSVRPRRSLPTPEPLNLEGWTGRPRSDSIRSLDSPRPRREFKRELHKGSPRIGSGSLTPQNSPLKESVEFFNESDWTEREEPRFYISSGMPEQKPTPVNPSVSLASSHFIPVESSAPKPLSQRNAQEAASDVFVAGDAAPGPVCRKCQIWYEDDEEDLIQCEVCSTVFHANCEEPPIDWCPSKAFCSDQCFRLFEKSDDGRRLFAEHALLGSGHLRQFKDMFSNETVPQVGEACEQSSKWETPVVIPKFTVRPGDVVSLRAIPRPDDPRKEWPAVVRHVFYHRSGYPMMFVTWLEPIAEDTHFSPLTADEVHKKMGCYSATCTEDKPCYSYRCSKKTKEDTEAMQLAMAVPSARDVLVDQLRRRIKELEDENARLKKAVAPVSPKMSQKPRSSVASRTAKGFACPCGRVFSNGQALGGHRGKCKFPRERQRDVQARNRAEETVQESIALEKLIPLEPTRPLNPKHYKLGRHEKRPQAIAAIVRRHGFQFPLTEGAARAHLTIARNRFSNTKLDEWSNDYGMYGPVTIPSQDPGTATLRFSREVPRKLFLGSAAPATAANTGSRRPISSSMDSDLIMREPRQRIPTKRARESAFSR